jgi:hypothetical protein
MLIKKQEMHMNYAMPKYASKFECPGLPWSVELFRNSWSSIPRFSPSENI